MGKGGRRYPIEHAEGRELDFASLPLGEALFSDKSLQGDQFGRDWLVRPSAMQRYMANRLRPGPKVQK